MIRIQDLVKTYQRGTEEVHALNGVSLTINAGEFISVIGPSGSGKTTLINIMGCLDNPSAGSMAIDNKAIFSDGKHLSEKELTYIRREYFGYIFQKFYLIPTLTVEENILLPNVFQPKKHIDNLLDLVKQLGINDRLHHYPGQLSGGEMQRVAIARAVINNPRILLADEPTGNLDSKRSDEIGQVLRQLNRDKGITVILITHNPALAAVADRIIEIQDGMIKL